MHFIDGEIKEFTPETTKKISLNMSQVRYITFLKGGENDE